MYGVNMYDRIWQVRYSQPCSGSALLQKRVEVQNLQQEETEHLDALKLEDEEIHKRVQLQREERDGEDEDLLNQQVENSTSVTHVTLGQE